MRCGRGRALFLLCIYDFLVSTDNLLHVRGDDPSQERYISGTKQDGDTNPRIRSEVADKSLGTSRWVLRIDQSPTRMMQKVALNMRGYRRGVA